MAYLGNFFRIIFSAEIHSHRVTCAHILFRKPSAVYGACAAFGSYLKLYFKADLHFCVYIVWVYMSKINIGLFHDLRVQDSNTLISLSLIIEYFFSSKSQQNIHLKKNNTFSKYCFWFIKVSCSQNVFDVVNLLNIIETIICYC